MGKQPLLTFKYLGKEHKRSVGPGTLKVGRGDDNDIVIDNPYISRYHAEIITEGGRHLIRDLGSTSGTFANGERIAQRRLKDGDRVRLGRERGIEFQFNSGDPNGDSELNWNSMPRSSLTRAIQTVIPSTVPISNQFA